MAVFADTDAFLAMASTRTEIEAYAFRQLVAHLQARTDSQNIDMMNLAGFCRNCLGKWYLKGARTQGDAPPEPATVPATEPATEPASRTTYLVRSAGASPTDASPTVAMFPQLDLSHASTLIDRPWTFPLATRTSTGWPSNSRESSLPSGTSSSRNEKAEKSLSARSENLARGRCFMVTASVS